MFSKKEIIRYWWRPGFASKAAGPNIPKAKEILFAHFLGLISSFELILSQKTNPESENRKGKEQGAAKANMPQRPCSFSIGSYVSKGLGDD